MRPSGQSASVTAETASCSRRASGSRVRADEPEGLYTLIRRPLKSPAGVSPRELQGKAAVSGSPAEPKGSCVDAGRRPAETTSSGMHLRVDPLVFCRPGSSLSVVSWQHHLATRIKPRRPRVPEVSRYFAAAYSTTYRRSWQDRSLSRPYPRCPTPHRSTASMSV